MSPLHFMLRIQERKPKEKIMSNTPESEYNFEEGNVPATQAEDDAKGMRAELAKKAAENATLAAQLEQTQRQVAVDKAELKLNDKQLAALEAVHSGEWTAEAVKATADSLGFVTETVEPPVVNEAEAASLARVASLGAGADAPNLSQELESKMASWEHLGRSPMTDTEFMAEVKGTLGENFFDEHQRNLLNK